MPAPRPTQPRLFHARCFLGILFLAGALFPSMLCADATRELLADGRFGLVISVTPPPGTKAYAVEEKLPVGIDVISIEEDGVWDPYTRKVKWGPFIDAAPRELRLEFIEAGGSFFFEGWSAFDDSGATMTTGISMIQRADPQTYFAGWLRLNFPGAQSLPGANSILPGARLPLIAQYAMGIEPGSADYPFQITDTAQQLELHFQRDNRRSDIDLVLEHSTDLEDWAPVDFKEATAIPLDEGREQIQIPIDPSDSAAFYRLHFESSQVD